jgi:hypothetical protein
MKNISLLKYFAIIMTGCLVITCHDQSTSISTNPVSYHSSGCIVPGLEKSLTRSSPDSIFNYSFQQNILDLEFSVIASCGRAENAFIVQYTICGDIIDISVLDTNQSIERCECLYMVTVSDIPAIRDRYKVRCTYYRSLDSLNYICHFVEVHQQCAEIYEKMLFEREGGGNLVFTLTPTGSADTLLFNVEEMEFRDTTIQGIIWSNRTTKEVFDTLSDALNGKIQITGDYVPDTTLDTGTWAYIYMINSSGRTEVTNRVLRNALLVFEYIVRSKLGLIVVPHLPVP